MSVLVGFFKLLTNEKHLKELVTKLYWIFKLSVKPHNSKYFYSE